MDETFFFSIISKLAFWKTPKILFVCTKIGLIPLDTTTDVIETRSLFIVNGSFSKAANKLEIIIDAQIILRPEFTPFINHRPAITLPAGNSVISIESPLGPLETLMVEIRTINKDKNSTFKIDVRYEGGQGKLVENFRDIIRLKNPIWINISMAVLSILGLYILIELLIRLAKLIQNSI